MAEASTRRLRAIAALMLGLCMATAPGAQPATASDQASSPASSGTASAGSADAIVRFAPPQAVPTAADPALEAHMLAVTGELRCLVCQNQTIADSHADLAVDLRQEVRELIKSGRTDDQIRRYMTDRYGDFVLYRPPLKPTTLVLWLGPALLLAIAIVALVVVIARRGKMADDRFEPDPDWEGEVDIERDPDLAPSTSARPGAPA